MEKQDPQLVHLADFKPPSAARAWVSIPNPNGLPLIATATSEKTVRVYSLSNFTLHSTLEGGHSRSIRSVAWKPSTQNNGELCIATGSFDSTMGLWRRKEEDGALGAGGSGEPLELEVTRNGIKHDEEGSDDGEDWEFAIVLEGHDSEVKHVAYSPSGQWLASCSRDKSIWIWEEIGEEGDDEFETVAVLQEHTADVKCVSWRAASSYKDEGEVLASASYDDTIRLWREEEEGEWGCFAVMEGHDGTVWSLEWEPSVSVKRFDLEDGRPPRLLSSSADGTIRLWSLAPAAPSPNKPSYFNSGIPSTMRPAPAAEKWICTAILPKVHDLPVYSISWSARTGQVVSTGGDGRVAIYEERKREPAGTEAEPKPEEAAESAEPSAKTEWVVLTILDGAHGPYEVNHVTWCPRYDAGKKSADEEIVITTGDDGLVKAWTVEGSPIES
ncbi:putative cytosolic iron-sulfur protein assembly protein 1 [Coleophoma cylindrospora]|uniref:Probable cytosolic iron-sulfur protein assembly protein 1 n=1 Tax=Coleophoma cylindrospora TaxID=1849047 RepID=A0A3D8QG01_9HELO|nr:putative cytosolic iron-sulfur protein assembly protein 1 [Coleophoma cylindrospora]